MNNKYIRKIILDTETTGINQINIINENYYSKHRIIEIGGIEIINRKITKNNFHVYLNPERLIDSKSFKIHGISNNFLLNKPKFKDIFKKFINYIDNSELIIHNAKFDIAFLNYEFKLIKEKKMIKDYCKITDSLSLARKMFPGKKNSLDYLCNYYGINNNIRNKHGALIDAQLLAKIYLLLTSEQKNLLLENNIKLNNKIKKNNMKKIKIIFANNKEIKLHKKYYKKILQKKYFI